VFPFLVTDERLCDNSTLRLHEPAENETSAHSVWALPSRHMLRHSQDAWVECSRIILQVDIDLRHSEVRISELYSVPFATCVAEFLARSHSCQPGRYGAAVVARECWMLSCDLHSNDGEECQMRQLMGDAGDVFLFCVLSLCNGCDPLRFEH